MNEIPLTIKWPPFPKDYSEHDIKLVEAMCQASAEVAIQFANEAMQNNPDRRLRNVRFVLPPQMEKS